MIGEERLEELWERLRALELDYFIAMDDGHWTKNSPHPFYISGVRATSSAILWKLGDKPFKRELRLVVDSRYAEAAKRALPRMNVFIHPAGGFEGLAALIPNSSVRVGFESNVMTVGAAERLRKEIPAAEFVPIEGERNPLLTMRRHKDEEEVKLLRRAQTITEVAMWSALDQIRPGMSAAEIAGLIEMSMRNQGASGTAFDSLVASGLNSVLPHGFATGKKLQTGEVVQLDVGAKFEGYHGDCSRVFFLGKSDPGLLKVFDRVSDALDYGISLCQPGENCRKIHQAVVDFLGEYGDFFMHGLGHGVGLEIHEPPLISVVKSPADMVLEVGDVVTIEPGVYLPGKGGIRLEDMIVIRENGAEYISPHIFPPDQLIQI